MSNLIVLGMGLMGPTIAKDCVASSDTSRVLGCDIDEDKLRLAKKYVGNSKFETKVLDLTDHQSLIDTLRGWDVVINATASKFSLYVLEAAMQADVDLVDLSGGSYPLEGDIYDEVRESGITAIPGCGVDPGLIDILSGNGMDIMDEVKEVKFACGGLPKDPEPPLYYKIVFGGKKMPIRPGKVPMIKDGSLVEVERYTDLEPILVEGLPEMEAFYDGFPSSLLKLCEEEGVETFKGKTIRYKGFVEKLNFLLDLGVIDSDPINYKGKEIVPINFFHDLIYPIVKFDPAEGDRDLTILLVTVKGTKDGTEMEVCYNMIDFYDEEEDITSMARTTSYTAAIIARMLARGDITEKGIQWPVRLVRGPLFNELMEKLGKRGIDVTETITSKKTL